MLNFRIFKFLPCDFIVTNGVTKVTNMCLFQNGN